MAEKRKKILIGCTGSVASIKIPQLVEEILKLDDEIEVRVVATDHAVHFFDPESLLVKVYRDSDEWQMWQKRGDSVLHIELRRWADICLITPLDANTLAKVASGICDNLLLCLVRAWDMSKPLLFAPAMNTMMYSHPITRPQIDVLKSWGYTEIPCIEKLLMCNDRGLGAMAEVSTITETVRQVLVNVQQ